MFDRWVHQPWLKLRMLFKRQQLDRDLAAELEFHLATKEQKLIEEGMSPSEARYAARRGFGNALLSKENSRALWGFPFVESLLQDLRYGLRQSQRSVGFTAVAVLSLALGIGANTAIFTVMDAVLLKSVPVKEPDGLVMLRDPDQPGWGRGWGGWYCYRQYTELRRRNGVFSGLVARANFKTGDIWEAYVSIDGGRVETLPGEGVSGNFFDVLGVKPYIGRTFSLDDEQPSRNLVAVLSYNGWIRRFAGNPAVVGKKIGILNHSFTIIGVTPPGFFGLQVESAPAFWVPMTVAATFWAPIEGDRGDSNFLDDPRSTMLHTDWLQVVGRLKPGTSLLQAEASLQPLNRQLRADEVESMNWKLRMDVNESDRKELLNRVVALSPAARGFSCLRNLFFEPLMVLVVLVGLVLLIACSTFANLLLARGVARQKEIAVRLALGAGRRRLARHMLTESLMLSVAGGALGVLIAWWGASALAAAVDAPALQVAPDIRVLGFTLALSLLTGLLFGLAPVFQASQTQVMDAMKEQGATLVGHASHIALRKGLIALQVSLSVLLLSGAGLLVRSLRELKSVESGIDRTNVLQMRVHPYAYSDATEDQYRLYYHQLLDRIEALPGVKSAAVSWGSLQSDLRCWWNIKFSGHDRLRATSDAVTSRFFETLRLPLVAGRLWSPQDDYRPVREAVVSESFARRVFGDASPLGGTFTSWKDTTFTIVGVVKDSKHAYNPRRDDSEAVYFSPWDFWKFDLEIYVRTAQDPRTLMAAVTRTAQSINQEAQVEDLRTLEDQTDTSLRNERLLAWLSTVFGVLAALLAAIGLYGVIAYSVVRRTREIGLRLALGAGRAQIQWLVMQEVLGLIGVGAAVGIPAALGATRMTQNLLFGIAANDPATMAGAAAFMGAVAFMAGILPAYRATRVDPLTALRSE